MRARTAVIPAAGMGTRFLPATKAVPKELLPIIDRPALQLVLDEAVGAGIEHVVIVTSHAKPAIQAYFEPAPHVVDKLRSTGRTAMADTLERVGRELRVSFAYQDVALGLGHAVGCARELVGDEPFAVMLPDELMGDSTLLAQMIELCERTGGSVVGLMEVPPEKVSAYGVVTPAGPLATDGVLPIATMVEKPAMADAPSNLIIIGRYVLTPDVFDRIAEVQPGTGGEIQLTDALRMQAESGPFHGVLRGDVRRYDTGNPLGWLTAVVELALADPDIGDQFREWLRTRR
jgi:UTP--glucose-1-phosphate uridylyltransferase